MRKAFVFIFTVLFIAPFAGAVDVSPSKNQGAARAKNDAAGDGAGWFSGIFDGNPESRDKKIDKVKNIKRDDFNVSLTLQSNTLSQSVATLDSQYFIQPFFSIQNKSKLLKTFSFPNSQKYDFFVVDSSGKEIFRWSESRMFTEVIGSTLINPGESVRYTESISLFDKEGHKLPPGEYTLVATLVGYPDFTESIKFNIIP